CIVYSSLSELQAQGIASGFLQFAEEAWLTSKAHYDYAVDRYVAAAATGLVTFTNSSAYEYNELAGDVIVGSTFGKNYRTSEDLHLPANGTATVFVVAAEAGNAATAAPGEISIMVTPLLGVTCANPDALVGSDAESDQLLRERCSAKLGSLSQNGAPDAYKYVALSSVHEDGSSLGITRVQTEADGYGHVFVYVADADGDVAPEDVLLIEENIESVYRVVPLGVHATVHSAIPVPVSITAEIWVHGSALTDVDITNAVDRALIDFFAVQPVGGNIIAPSTTGYIYLDAIRAAIMEAVPTGFHCVVNTPAADVPLTTQQVAVFSAPANYLTVHQEV